MAELAIQGTYAIQVSGDRNFVPTTPRLALLPGGKIDMKSAFSTIKGDRLDIRGTAENPSIIENSYAGAADKSAYYALLAIAVTGDEDGVLRLKYTGGADERAFQRAFRVTQGFTNFFGTVIVDGAYTWLRPETTATTFDIDGTLCVTNGANVYVATVSPTFGSLVMAEGTTLRIAAGKAITVTNSLQIAEGAKITIDQLSSTAWNFDDGSNSPPEVGPVLSVCGAANAAAVDRGALLSAIEAGSSFKDAVPGGIPRLKLVESVREDGGVDFKISHMPVVAQTAHCMANAGPYGFEQYEEFLSDRREISPAKDYYTEFNVYFKQFKNGYEFPGRSLTIRHVNPAKAQTFGFYNEDKMTVNDLRLVGDAASPSRIRQMKQNGNVYLCGNAAIYGTVNFRVSGSNRFNLDSNLSGPGDIAVTLDMANVGAGSACRGTLSLGGANDAYAGRFLVGCGRMAMDPNVEAFTNLALRATSSASLGGALDAFTFDSVKIADACKLWISETATFDAANRGWCLMDGATVEVDDGKTATMNGAITFGGATVKAGAGALVLGGAAKFYDSGSDTATDTPGGESLLVAAGEIGATSAAALAGVSVTFADGAGLVALPGTSGLVLSSAPVVEGATLPVRVVLDDGFESGTADLLTLPASAAFDASKFAVKKVRGYFASEVKVREESGSTVYFVTLGRAGFSMSIR